MNLIVAGGGTAGFITALILKQCYGENINVKMLIPEKIGIIGVGEGSTEHFDDFRSFMGISVEELIAKTKATGKSGIKFVDWMKDKTYYHVYQQIFLVFMQLMIRQQSGELQTRCMKMKCGFLEV